MPGGGTFHFTGRKAGLPPRPAGVIVGHFCPIAHSGFALRISKQRLIRAAIPAINPLASPPVVSDCSLQPDSYIYYHFENLKESLPQATPN